MSAIFDLDTVAVDFQTPFIKLLQDKYSVGDVDIEKLDTWWWNDAVGLDRQTFDKAFDEFCYTGGFATLKPLPGIYNALEYCKKKYGKIYFVTNRRKSVKEDTIDNISYLFPTFYTGDNLLIVDKKGYICKQLEAEIAIEDGPHHAVDIMVNSNAFVYLKDTACNRFLNNTKSLKRIKHLDEFVEMDTKR